MVRSGPWGFTMISSTISHKNVVFSVELMQGGYSFRLLALICIPNFETPQTKDHSLRPPEPLVQLYSA
ncbi:hypothetical protein PISMIDRAFT_675231 [Pisolithus microcarpus 441]|uniref:Uncharacterized protein n=1 Tax=Pisolithus microcarpus 441 TaxID=765257 RepID=A0A0C9YPG4_9AGAM|nr:hypothetical protein PISMIDRAFT_675231 [Pisolithus microcarpus 441]